MKPKVLIGCEFSGIVRDEFTKLGWDAWSCDLLPSETPGQHLQCDVLEALDRGWDLAIFHPPCTYLCSSGMHWTTRGLRDPKLTEDALEFVRRLLAAPIPHIALENPIGCISTRIRKPDFKIQPWQFGHPEAKNTCFWTKNLPPIKPTNILTKPESGIWKNQTPSGQNKLGPSEKRWAERSKTYAGVASAIASQWGQFVLSSLQNSHIANAAASHGAPPTAPTTPTVTV